MPKQYEAIKENLLAKGEKKEVAQRIAAATYNKNRPKGATPMGPNYEQRVKQGAKGKRPGVKVRAASRKK
jgi:hypothetical protein